MKTLKLHHACNLLSISCSQLDDEKNLVEQGVEGDGMVQMHVELKLEDEVKKINIIDVLKPAEEYLNMDNGQSLLIGNNMFLDFLSYYLKILADTYLLSNIIQ